MPYRRTAAHWVILLGAVQEPGAAYAVPHYDEGPARALPAGCRPDHRRPARKNPARPIANIFVSMDDIGGRVWGKGCKGRMGWGERPQGPEGGKE